MHPIILSGITHLGGQILSKIGFDSPKTFSNNVNFNNLLESKAKVTGANNTLESLVEKIKNHPDLKEACAHIGPNEKLTLEFTPEGHCLIKGSDKTLLQCSPNSELGQLCIAFASTVANT